MRGFREQYCERICLSAVAVFFAAAAASKFIFVPDSADTYLRSLCNMISLTKKTIFFNFRLFYCRSLQNTSVCWHLVLYELMTLIVRLLQYNLISRCIRMCSPIYSSPFRDWISSRPFVWLGQICKLQALKVLSYKCVPEFMHLCHFPWISRCACNLCTFMAQIKLIRALLVGLKGACPGLQVLRASQCR